MIEKVVVSKECRVLIPNGEHKNFTETEESFDKGEILTGRYVNIDGLRRGKPFTYRLFITSDNRYIYQNCIEPMKTTEVMLGADESQTPTIVNLRENETFSRNKVYGLIGGGVAGFALAKYKKKDWKKVMMFTAVGALVGFGGAYLLDRQRAIYVTPSE
jgi:hypothetical protein